MTGSCVQAKRSAGTWKVNMGLTPCPSSTSAIIVGPRTWICKVCDCENQCLVSADAETLLSLSMSVTLLSPKVRNMIGWCRFIRNSLQNRFVYFEEIVYCIGIYRVSHPLIPYILSKVLTKFWPAGGLVLCLLAKQSSQLPKENITEYSGTNRWEKYGRFGHCTVSDQEKLRPWRKLYNTLWEDREARAHYNDGHPKRE